MKGDPTQGIFLSKEIRPAEADYPAAIRELVKPGPVLYCRGNIALLRSPNMLAVVGSRAISGTNEQSLHMVLAAVHDLPITVISGLAFGIDSLAHDHALEHNLPTVAVVGSSVEDGEIYPRSNQGRAHAILSAGGLLLSPFAPKTPVRNYNFPIRNQLIAALASAVAIISAAKKSGALITAQLALDYGKELFVVPGSLADPLYQGSNQLLRAGAHPLLSGEDLLEYFGITRRKQREYRADDPDEEKLIRLLKEGSATQAALEQKLALPPSVLNSLITRLELRGWLRVSADGTLTLA